jgi:hypothetical protein
VRALHALSALLAAAAALTACGAPGPAASSGAPSVVGTAPPGQADLPPSAAAGAGEPAPAAVRDNADTAVYDCTPQPRVAVYGDANDLTFTGTCAELTVAGDTNTIRVASVGEVALTGNGNTLIWSGTEPVVNDRGTGNSVVRA